MSNRRSVKAEDIDPKTQTVKIHQEKKRSEFVRIVPVPSKLFWVIIGEYLKTMPFKDSKLFEISERRARNIVYSFTEKYLGRRIRLHTLRHSYATYVLKKARDLEVVRRLLGHAGYKWLKCYLDYTQGDISEILRSAFSLVKHFCHKIPNMRNLST